MHISPSSILASVVANKIAYKPIDKVLHKRPFVREAQADFEAMIADEMKIVLSPLTTTK